MTKILGALFLALAPVAAGLATTSAQAYSATATNVDYTSTDCFNSNITVSGLDPSTGTTIYVYAPNGAIADEDYAYDQTVDVFQAQLCHYSDPVGTYTVTVGQTPVTTFTVAQPSLSARTVHARSKQAAVLGELKLRDTGLRGVVTLEKRKYGYWTTARRIASNSRGQVTVRCAKRGAPKSCRGLYRLVFNDVATTRAFHLPRR